MLHPRQRFITLIINYMEAVLIPNHWHLHLFFVLRWYAAEGPMTGQGHSVRDSSELDLKSLVELEVLTDLTPKEVPLSVVFYCYWMFHCHLMKYLLGL